MAYAGEDALIDCRVQNQGNYTVIWKYVGANKDLDSGTVLTAGKVRVIDDKRFSAAHHERKLKVKMRK